MAAIKNNKRFVQYQYQCPTKNCIGIVCTVKMSKRQKLCPQCGMPMIFLGTETFNFGLKYRG